MKKYIIAAVTLAAFTGLSIAQTAPAPAQNPTEAPKMEAPKAEKKAVAKKPEAKKMETVNGSISAIDATANTITVKDAKGLDKVLTVEAAKIAALKVGDNVKIKVKENKAETIKVIKKHEAKKPEVKK